MRSQKFFSLSPSSYSFDIPNSDKPKSVFTFSIIIRASLRPAALKNSQAKSMRTKVISILMSLRTLIFTVLKLNSPSPILMPKSPVRRCPRLASSVCQLARPEDSLRDALMSSSEYSLSPSSSKSSRLLPATLFSHGVTTSVMGAIEEYIFMLPAMAGFFFRLRTSLSKPNILRNSVLTGVSKPPII